MECLWEGCFKHVGWAFALSGRGCCHRASVGNRPMSFKVDIGGCLVNLGWLKEHEEDYDKNCWPSWEQAGDREKERKTNLETQEACAHAIVNFKNKKNTTSWDVKSKESGGEGARWTGSRKKERKNVNYISGKERERERERESDRQKRQTWMENQNISDQNWDTSREKTSDRITQLRQFQTNNLEVKKQAPKFLWMFVWGVCFFWMCLIFQNLRNVYLSLSEFVCFSSEFWSEFVRFSWCCLHFGLHLSELVWCLAWICLNLSDFLMFVKPLLYGF